MQSRLWTQHNKNVKNEAGKNVRRRAPSVLWEAGYATLQAHVCFHVSAGLQVQPAVCWNSGVLMGKRHLGTCFRPGEFCLFLPRPQTFSCSCNERNFESS